jgi:Carboxypeptidase regulatory-like domain
MTALRALAVMLWVLAFMSTENHAQENGSIRGVVVDSSGVPIPGAKVNASPLGGWKIVRFVQFAETDEQGRFVIERLQLGKYAVFGMKEAAQYPNMSSSFYSNNVFPSAVLTASAPVAEVRVQLGPKAGILTGHITSAENGFPLNDAGLKLTRAAVPDEWLSTSVRPEYSVLVPSNTDVLLEVSAPGFETWSLPHPLRLSPGAEFRLDISLQRSHDPNLHPSRFLVPEGYTGWVLLEYKVKGAVTVLTEDDIKTFKFPSSGMLITSSPGPERGAEDEYFYYSANGSLRPIPRNYLDGKGMVWGQHEGTRNGELSQYAFFVGTEDQYKKYQTRAQHPGPVETP